MKVFAPALLYSIFHLLFYKLHACIKLYQILDLNILGKTQPGWGKEDSKPGWWPSEVPFIDVNNRKQRPRLEQLISIMNAFKNKGDQEMEECDVISVHYEPESPSEVPIPVISTPASTSSNDPPVAPLPDILASPISCSTGNFSDLAEIWH